MDADAPSHDVTVMLQSAADGDAAAAARLLPVVYEELRRLAGDRLRRTPPGTLQATALVHEAYLRLIGDQDPGWKNRGHFFGAAARAMRDIVVEQARRKAAVKHGGGRDREPLDDVAIVLAEPAEDVLALHEALVKLEQLDARKADIVMLRYFAGLTQAETAAALDVSERTVEREWRYIKAWLRSEVDATRGA